MVILSRNASLTGAGRPPRLVSSYGDSVPEAGKNIFNRWHLKDKTFSANETQRSVAEREGFEPSVGVNLHTLSKRAP